MIQRLIILGILKKGPSSGYEIKKCIKKDLGVFSQIDTQSIYYPLKKMEAEGLIKKKSISTKHRKKYVYHLTPRGEKEFFSLCKQVLISPRRPFMELDLTLYFLPFLDKKKIIPLLRLRLRFLEKVKNWLLAKEKELKGAPQNLIFLLRHHYKLAKTEKDFLKDMVDFMKDERRSL